MCDDQSPARLRQASWSQDRARSDPTSKPEIRLDGSVPCLQIQEGQARPVSITPAQDRDSFAGPWSVRTRNPLLLLNPRFDPATPHHNALNMNCVLSGSRLVTVNGWGHTALATRSACKDDSVERYFIHGTLPDPGTVCPSGIVPFTSSG